MKLFVRLTVLFEGSPWAWLSVAWLIAFLFAWLLYPSSPTNLWQTSEGAVPEQALGVHYTLPSGKGRSIEHHCPPSSSIGQAPHCNSTRYSSLARMYKGLQRLILFVNKAARLLLSGNQGYGLLSSASAQAMPLPLSGQWRTLDSYALSSDTRPGQCPSRQLLALTKLVYPPATPTGKQPASPHALLPRMSVGWLANASLALVYQGPGQHNNLLYNISLAHTAIGLERRVSLTCMRQGAEENTGQQSSSIDHDRCIALDTLHWQAVCIDTWPATPCLSRPRGLHAPLPLAPQGPERRASLALVYQGLERRSKIAEQCHIEKVKQIQGVTPLAAGPSGQNKTRGHKTSIFLFFSNGEFRSIMSI